MTTSANKPPIWFWIVSVLTLIWNGMGVHGYISQAYQTKAFTEEYTAEQIDVMNGMPSWYTALFAIAVFSGALGCLLLLLRKKFAKLLLILSFLTATIMMVYFLFVADLKGVDFSDNKIMAYIVIAIAAFLVWFSKKAASKRWIN
jgi:small basic protein